MTAAVLDRDTGGLRDAYLRLEEAREEAAEAEQSAYARWLDAMGAYEVVRDECADALAAYAAASGS